MNPSKRRIKVLCGISATQWGAIFAVIFGAWLANAGVATPITVATAAAIFLGTVPCAYNATKFLFLDDSG